MADFRNTTFFKMIRSDPERNVFCWFLSFAESTKVRDSVKIFMTLLGFSGLFTFHMKFQLKTKSFWIQLLDRGSDVKNGRKRWATIRQVFPLAQVKSAFFCHYYFFKYQLRDRKLKNIFNYFIKLELWIHFFEDMKTIN